MHYESHELVGLTEEEREWMYCSHEDDESLRTIIDKDLKKVLDDAFAVAENK